jgi:hypothetical protein
LGVGKKAGARPAKGFSGGTFQRRGGREAVFSSGRNLLKNSGMKRLIVWNADSIAVGDSTRPASLWRAGTAAAGWSFWALFTSYSQRLVSLSGAGLETIFAAPERQEKLTENSELFSP